MLSYCDFEDECELQYQVAQRPECRSKRKSKTYSPRHEKQRSPATARNGIQRRGTKTLRGA